jgi:nicotinate-nucleotide adenylyltransferase
MGNSKQKIGLYFGSFNPIHIGHMMIAEFMAEFTDLTEVWFVVSPQNPHKQKLTMLSERERLHMVQLAIGKDPRFKTCDIEFYLPKPSYTINTLTYLSEKNPTKQFVLIIGGDNLQSFSKWKNYEQILKYYYLYVYKRQGAIHNAELSENRIKLVDAPQIEISSSFIRKSIAAEKSVKYFLPNEVDEYIKHMNYYK